MSNVLIENLQTIKDARDNIKTAIENKGAVGVTDNITTYADLIDNISGGSGDVKLFETIEAMQADSNPQEGDLAVVYRESLANIKLTTVTNTVIFPVNVTIPYEIQSENSYTFYTDDWNYHIDIRLNSGYINISIYKDEEQENIYYYTNDGLNFTMEGDYDPETGEPVPVTENKIITMPYNLLVDSYNWDDLIGYFVNINGHDFEGLFSYKQTDDLTRLDFMKNVVSPEEFETESVNIEFIIQTLNDLFSEEGELSDLDQWGAIIVKRDNIISLYSLPSSGYWIMSGLHETENQYQWLLKNTSGWSQTNGNNIEFNLDEETYEIKYYTDGQEIIDTSEYPVCSLSMYRDYETREFTISPREFGFNYNNDSIYIKPSYTQIYKYLSASMDNLTLSNKNQLFDNIVGYGSNGIIKGDGSIWNNINQETMMNILGLIGEQIRGTMYTENEENGFHYYNKKDFQENNSCVMVKTKSSPSSGYSSSVTLIGEDDTYCYKTTQSYTTSHTIEKINKNTLESEGTFTISHTTLWGSNLHYANGNIYIVGYGPSSDYKFYCIQYNLSTKTTTTIDNGVTTSGFSGMKNTYCFYDNGALYYGMIYNSKILGRKYVISSGTKSYIMNNVTMPTGYSNFIRGKHLIVLPSTSTDPLVAYDLTTWTSTTMTSQTYRSNSNYAPSPFNQIDTNKYILSWYNSNRTYYLTIFDSSNVSITEYNYYIPDAGALSCMILNSNTLLLAWGTFGTYILEISTGNMYHIDKLTIGQNSAGIPILSSNITNNKIDLTYFYNSLVKSTIYNLEELTPTYDMKVDLMLYRYYDNTYGSRYNIVINNL